jgi:hypothetical protein
MLTMKDIKRLRNLGCRDSDVTHYFVPNLTCCEMREIAEQFKRMQEALTEIRNSTILWVRDLAGNRLREIHKIAKDALIPEGE